MILDGFRFLSVYQISLANIPVILKRERAVIAIHPGAAGGDQAGDGGEPDQPLLGLRVAGLGVGGCKVRMLIFSWKD